MHELDLIPKLQEEIRQAHLALDAEGVEKSRDLPERIGKLRFKINDEYAKSESDYLLNNLRVAALNGLLANPIIAQALQLAANRNFWPPHKVHESMAETVEGYARAMLERANRTEEEPGAEECKPQSDTTQLQLAE